MGTATTADNTAEAILTRYADDVAFVVCEDPATTLPALADHLEAGAQHLQKTGIHGAEDWTAAASYLVDADRAEPDKRRTVLTLALWHLRNSYEMAYQYRAMV